MVSFSILTIGALASLVSIIGASPLGPLPRSDDADASADAAAGSSSTVIQFPKGTWNENIARTSSGGILLTQLNPSPALVYVANPTSPSPSYTTLKTFPSPATGATGIGQLGTDVFYVATLNYSFATFQPVPKTAQLWKVDLSKSTSNPPTTLVANLPQVKFINGITGVPGTSKLLIADYAGGLVYRVDVNSGAADVALNNAAVNTPSGAAGGVNGVKAPGDGFLYYSNSGTNSVGRMAIDKSTAQPTGNPQQLWKNTAVSPDDFFLLPQSGYGGPVAFVADSANNRVVAIDGNGGNNFTSIASIAGATSGVLADQNTIYIASTGGDNQYAQKPVPVGGALTRITRN